MPAKSRSQLRAIMAKCAKGEIPKKVCEEFKVSGAAYKRLPEKVKKKRKKR